ncbi:hypothetical protein D3C87_1554870 [compost metagenome]
MNTLVSEISKDCCLCITKAFKAAIFFFTELAVFASDKQSCFIAHSNHNVSNAIAIDVSIRKSITAATDSFGTNKNW